MFDLIHPNSRSRLNSEARPKRGFSLIEAAIVLGVVGLVIGGIWVAAATFYENMKVTETISGIISTAKNIQNSISITEADSIAYGAFLTQYAIDSGSLPKNWVSGTNIKSPFNTTAYIRHFTGRFSFYIFDLPMSSCIKLISQISTIGAQAANQGIGTFKDTLSTIATYQSGTLISSLTAFPVNLTTAKTACNTSDVLIFSFGYSRIN